MSAAGFRIVVLLSLGRHPVSGRARRNPLDARALEIGLRLKAAAPGVDLQALHAGDPTEPALRDYLGQGLDKLTVLDLPADHDPVQALMAAVIARQPDLVLAGLRAEGSEDSGLLPYCLAEALGHALVPAVTALDIDGASATITQALPRGRRRTVQVDLPLTVTVAEAAPAPASIAFARARKGRIEIMAAAGQPDPLLAALDRRPWRQRPRPMPVRKKGSAVDRLREMTGATEAQGRVLIDPDPREAAKAILDQLSAIGTIRVSQEPRREKAGDDRPSLLEKDP